MTTTSTVFALVGPKGSGKTYLGKLIERELGVPFLRVEPLFLQVLASRPPGPEADAEGFQLVEERLEECLRAAGAVAFESTGASPLFAPLLRRLREHHRVRLVAMRAPPELCLERVRTRASAEHIPVSDGRVREINERAAAVELPWDLVVDNAGPASDAELLAAFSTLLP